jgi:predicted ATP-grasp superfamily ATP-dependent carboligase
VLGDLDLVRPLRRAGVRCAAALAHDDPARYSRFVVGGIEPLDHWTDQTGFAEQLVAWGQRQTEPPVLFYQTDGDLLTVSRHRDVLARTFRFVLPHADLVEDLVDKARFSRLADRLDLPVPRSLVLRAPVAPSLPDMPYPLIVKPLLRQALTTLHVAGKAVRVDDADQLRRLVESIGDRVDLLAQKWVPGPESCIEGYHAYVDSAGTVVAEFTGRKIRTHPRQFGHTTALEITHQPDVAELGRELLSRIDLQGVAKVDLKRDPRGRLHVIEINPRFNLWHSPGAVAGVNLPVTVYSDLTDRPRPPSSPARPGVTWCSPRQDHWAVRAGELSRTEWLATLLSSSVRSGLDWDDPSPLLRGLLYPAVRRRWPRRTRSSTVEA